VQNKIDLDATGPVAEQEHCASGQGTLVQRLRISASRGDGVRELIAALVTFAQDFFGAGAGALIARERQRRLLEETADLLRRSLDIESDKEELVAEDLRAAAYSLGRLLGRVEVEDILDVVFREFCIGK
jgi:tRNA modification GTPase